MMSDLPYTRYGTLGADAVLAASARFEAWTETSPLALAPRTLTAVQQRGGGGYVLLVEVPHGDIADRGAPAVSVDGAGVGLLAYDEHGGGETQFRLASGQAFPIGEPVLIAGWFGYGTYTRVGTLPSGWNIGVDTLELSGIAAGDVLRVDDELVRIDTGDISSQAHAVTRGVGGTAEADHTFGAAVRRLVVPLDLAGAVEVVAKRWAETLRVPGAGAFGGSADAPPVPRLEYVLRT